MSRCIYRPEDGVFACGINPGDIGDLQNKHGNGIAFCEAMAGLVQAKFMAGLILGLSHPPSNDDVVVEVKTRCGNCCTTKIGQAIFVTSDGNCAECGAKVFSCGV